MQRRTFLASGVAVVLPVPTVAKPTILPRYVNAAPKIISLGTYDVVSVRLKNRDSTPFLDIPK